MQDKLFDAYGRGTVYALIQRQPAMLICIGSDSGLLFLLRKHSLPIAKKLVAMKCKKQIYYFYWKSSANPPLCYFLIEPNCILFRLLTSDFERSRIIPF